MMGIGSARGADRAVKAAELAIASPLLESSITGAQGVLLSIQGGSNLGLYEINDAANVLEDFLNALPCFGIELEWSGCLRIGLQM